MISLAAVFLLAGRKEVQFRTLSHKHKTGVQLSAYPMAVLPFFMLLQLAQSYQLWRLLPI